MIKNKPLQNNSGDYMPGEKVLFIIHESTKKRIVTTVVFATLVLICLAGIFIFKNIDMSIAAGGGLIMAFWPLSDAYGRIEVTNFRIRYSNFAKITAKAEDVPLDKLALCRELVNAPKIELLFLVDDSKTLQSIRHIVFNKADKNAKLLMQLPCPKQKDLEYILEHYRKM